MFAKINCWQIFTDHHQTLRNGNNPMSLGDCASFIFVPIFFALGATLAKKFNSDMIGVFATVMSVFAALLFNLLILMNDFKLKVDRLNSPDTHGRKIKEKIQAILWQTHANISYCVLLAIVTLFMLFMSLIFGGNCYLDYAFSFIIYFLTFKFIFFLLMALKRYYLLSNQLMNRPPQ